MGVINAKTKAEGHGRCSCCGAGGLGVCGAAGEAGGMHMGVG